MVPPKIPILALAPALQALHLHELVLVHFNLPLTLTTFLLQLLQLFNHLRESYLSSAQLRGPHYGKSPQNRLLSSFPLAPQTI